VGIAPDKKPAGPRNSFIIPPASLASPSLSFSLSLSAVLLVSLRRARARQRTIIANFRFGDATCQLSPRAALSPRVRDVYLAGSLWDLSRM